MRRGEEVRKTEMKLVRWKRRSELPLCGTRVLQEARRVETDCTSEDFIKRTHARARTLSHAHTHTHTVLDLKNSHKYTHKHKTHFFFSFLKKNHALTHTKEGGDYTITVIVVRNGIDGLSSNPRRDYIRFTFAWWHIILLGLSNAKSILLEGQ